MNISKNPRTNAEIVRGMWQSFFPEIELTVTLWFERYDSALLSRAMQIAARNIEDGKQLDAFDEMQVGRYVLGIIRRLKKGHTVRRTGTHALVKTEVWFAADYTITEDDKLRFKSRLQSSGDCLLFTGASTTGRYGRFSVNGRSISAHVFAFFFELGYLPAPNALGGVNGLQVAHNCRNRSCCNVRHLRLTTKAVNLTERVYPSAGEVDYGSHDGSPCSHSVDSSSTLPPASPSMPTHDRLSSRQPPIEPFYAQALSGRPSPAMSSASPRENMLSSGTPPVVDSCTTYKAEGRGCQATRASEDSDRDSTL